MPAKPSELSVKRNTQSPQTNTQETVLEQFQFYEMLQQIYSKPPIVFMLKLYIDSNVNVHDPTRTLMTKSSQQIPQKCAQQTHPK